MIGAPNGKTKRIEEQESFPTILVATDPESRHALVRNLWLDGYLVFEASCEADALFFVVSQSRPIHVLLTDANIEGRKLARTLNLYRHEMQALFVASCPRQSISDGLNPETAVAKVRELLRLPGQIAAEAAHRNQRAARNSFVTFPGSKPSHAVQRVANARNVENEEEARSLTRAAAVGRSR